MTIPSDRSALWNVPHQRNPFFTGREDLLFQLHQTLQADSTVALSHSQGISGLGGIGKTQTALEYAYRYRAEYDAVLWLQAESVAAIISGYVTLAHLLDLPEREERDQGIIVEAVLRWLRIEPGWLLVFDNMDDLASAEPFLPKAGRGHVLFTTRAHALAGLAQRIDVQQMEPETGALLLLRRASLISLQSSLVDINSGDRSVACEISQELDGLPLALDQAGAYIKETPCSLGEYLLRYRNRHQDLLEARGESNTDYPASVATTWSLSFEKVSQAYPAAASLLLFCAFLAPDAIPEKILTDGAAHLGPILSPVIKNPLQFDRIFKEVLRYSLLQREADEEIFTMHRLVQAVLRDTVPTHQLQGWFSRLFGRKTIETQQQWIQRVILVLNEAFPDVEFANWSLWERFLPHALVCAAWINQKEIRSRDAAVLLNVAGLYLLERTRYAEAEPLSVRALEIYEMTLRPTHPAIASSLNNLAQLYQEQGKYERAEPLSVRALEIYEMALGPTHPHTASSLSNLATLYQEQGKYEQAEPLSMRALAIREQALGAEHPDTAISLSNLAMLYENLGKYEQAEPLSMRALAIREQALGVEHPDTSISLHNLAQLYQKQGKYEQAEPLYKRALEIYEMALGPTHPHTAASLSNLAVLYQEQKKYKQAEPLYERALEIYEMALGPTHPHTAASLNNLALLYQEQRKYEQAESLYEQALVIAKQALGAEHPHTATCLSNLATLYQEQGKYEQAEPLHEQALAIAEQVLGSTHPDTANSLHNLAQLYEGQGKYEQAEPLYERTLAIAEQTLGAEHPHTASSLNNLATLYRRLGKDEQAELLYERALAITEQRLGAKHPNI